MTFWRYAVRYRRRDHTSRTYHLTVTAASPDEARAKAAINDPLFGSTVETPKRRGQVVDITESENRALWGDR